MPEQEATETTEQTQTTEATQETQTTETQEPTAAEQLKALQAKVEALETEKANSSESADSEELDTLYKQWFGGDETQEQQAGEEADPRDAQIKALQAELKKVTSMVQYQIKQSAQQKLCDKYAKEVPDWKEIESDVLKLAKKYPTLADEDLMALARAKRPKAATPPTPEKKPDPAKAESAKRAASEKPNSAGANADKEYTSLGDAALDTFRELQAQGGYPGAT